MSEYRAGLAVAANNSDLLRGTAGVELKLGMLDEGVARLEQMARLDPRSADGALTLGMVYGRLDDTKMPVARSTSRGRSGRPASLSATCVRGLPPHAATLLACERKCGPWSSPGRRRAVGYLVLRENILWALDDEQQQALLTLTPADSDGGKADWALALAEVSWLRADAAQARSYGEVAAAAYAHVLEGWGQAGEREQVMILRAYGLAYAGRVPMKPLPKPGERSR